MDLKIISKLREMTGAGIGDCKNALVEANGDLEKAVTVLRQKGEIKAAKKSDRTTKEGVIALAKVPGQVAAVALSCETDFVALNSDFIGAVDELAQKLSAAGEAGFREEAEAKIKNELVVKIGENLQLSDFGIIKGETLGSYLHSNKKVAAVVALVGGNESLANELAMQVAAMSPRYIASADVPAEAIEKEKEIYREQLKAEGKPENIWDKIMAGKLNKYYEDVCLLDQVYIKDDQKKVSDLVKEAGEGVVVKEIRRFQV